MAINFDKALGIQEQTLELRAKRAEIIANNLANADTPGFKAKSLDFDKALSNALSGNGFNLRTTHEKHYRNNSDGLSSGDVKYQIPTQPDTGDGNTVDAQKEMAAYGRNALEYQTTLQFLSNKFKGIRKALKGE
ncbi:MAG: flagellar basal body rod protein FlgB [Gammaproteobacteria bacterium]|nr:flagellar basal body rod protein FlgB [Gammaproteobacteria bacterium]